MNIKPRTIPFRSKTGLLAALAALVSMGAGPQDDVYRSTRRAGVRNGKHSGRNPGAFGGPKAAKAHRVRYIKQFPALS